MALKKRLGDSLVEQGLITQDQLMMALKEQKVRKKRLGQVLIELEFITERAMLEVLSEQLGVPLVSLNEFEVDPQVMELIPGGIAKEHSLMPLFIDGNRITVAMADPLDVFAIDQIQYKTNCTIDMVIAPYDQIMGAIRQYYGSSTEMSEIAANIATTKMEEAIEQVKKKPDKIENIEEQSPVVKFADMILNEAAEEEASDIHIEPDEKVLRVRYRVDGVLHHILDIPQNIQAALISRLKIMANMDIAEKRLPQDGRMAIVGKKASYDVRVNTLPTVWGEKIVMRLLDKSSVMIGLEKLGMLPEQLELFMETIREPNGIILLTGPTGSGKTSTLYGALNVIKSPQVNITTVENPVEYRIETINQVQIHSEIGMTFASALRAILRQDPDVIMVGEIRDAETATIAIESALTGHLVFSTLHTNDAPGAVTRLVEMGIEPYLLTPTILVVVAQRLLRTICPKCKEQIKPEEALIRDLELPLDDTPYYAGAGCVTCNKTGFKGRTGIQELFTLNDTIKSLMLKKASDHELKKAATETGMINLRQAAMIKAREGLTTLTEVLRMTREE